MNVGPDPRLRSNSSHELKGHILLVGGGKMGSALLEGWLALGMAADKLAVIEPQPSPEITALTDRGLHLNPPRPFGPEIGALVLAVKPQVAPEVMPVLQPFVGNDTVVVSIMAGRTLRFLERRLPDAALVRAMPNTPAAIGRGITVAVPNARVTLATTRAGPCDSVRGWQCRVDR